MSPPLSDTFDLQDELCGICFIQFDSKSSAFICPEDEASPAQADPILPLSQALGLPVLETSRLEPALDVLAEKGDPWFPFNTFAVFEWDNFPAFLLGVPGVPSAALGDDEAGGNGGQKVNIVEIFVGRGRPTRTYPMSVSASRAFSCSLPVSCLLSLALHPRISFTHTSRKCNFQDLQFSNTFTRIAVKDSCTSIQQCLLSITLNTCSSRTFSFKFANLKNSAESPVRYQGSFQHAK